MMSHLDPAKSVSSAPCLRSKRAPPKEVKQVISGIDGARASNDAWYVSVWLRSTCAAIFKTVFGKLIGVQRI